MSEGWIDTERPRTRTWFAIVRDGEPAYFSRDYDQTLDDAERAAVQSPARSFRVVSFSVRDGQNERDEAFRAGITEPGYPALWEHRGRARRPLPASEPDVTSRPAPAPASSSSGIVPVLVLLALIVGGLVVAFLIGNRDDQPEAPTPSGPSVSTPSTPSEPSVETKTETSTERGETRTETTTETPSETPTSSSTEPSSTTSDEPSDESSSSSSSTTE